MAHLCQAPFSSFCINCLIYSLNIPEEEGAMSIFIGEEMEAQGAPETCPAPHRYKRQCQDAHYGRLATETLGTTGPGPGAFTKDKNPSGTSRSRQWVAQYYPTPILAPPEHRPNTLTCPCTMAFRRASTAWRASGGRSGCSRSATAFQSASTACCHQQRGERD